MGFSEFKLRKTCVTLGVNRFTDKQWQRLAGGDLSLKSSTKIVTETKSRVSASKHRPKIVKSKCRHCLLSIDRN